MSDEKPVLPQRIPGALINGDVHIGQLGALDLTVAGVLDPDIGRAVIDQLGAQLPHAGTPIYDETVAALADPLTAPIPEPEQEEQNAEIP